MGRGVGLGSNLPEETEEPDKLELLDVAILLPSGSLVTNPGAGAGASASVRLLRAPPPHGQVREPR